MTFVRFEVRNGAVMAIGAIVGALADSAGNVLAVLCAAGKVLRDSHTSDALAAALNEVTAAMAAK